MFNFIFCCSGNDPKTEQNEENFPNTQPVRSFRKTSSRKQGGSSQTTDAYGRNQDKSTTVSKKPIAMVDESRLMVKPNIAGLGKTTTPNSGQASQIQSVILNQNSTLSQSDDRQALRQGMNLNGIQIRPLVIEGANDLAFQRTPSIFIAPSRTSK